MNPFIHYRQRLDSYALARARGWSDARFVALVEELDTAVSRVQGHGFRCTPFTDAPALAHALGLDAGHLWVKDDTGNVGGSHKARHLFGVLLQQAVRDERAGELAVASCGNAALAAAVVARAAGKPLAVFIPAWADPHVVSQLEVLGARIVVCERRAGEQGDPTYLRFGEAVARGAMPFSCQATMTPATLDGGRTIGWEMAQQIAARGIRGVARLFVQVGGGALASAAWLGLREGIEREKAAVTPVLYPVQTAACAPLARAWSLLERAAPHASDRSALARTHPGRFMWAWEEVGRSAASGILDDVTYDWLGLVQAMSESGGRPLTVSEDEVVQAHRLLHAHTAIDADATGTAGLAGVLHASARGAIAAADRVLVLVTGVTRRPGTASVS